MRSRRLPLFVFAILLLVAVIAAIVRRRFRVPKRIHPHVERYDIVTLDVAGIGARASRSEPFELPLGPDTVRVRVAPAPLVEEGTEILEVGEDGELAARTVPREITFAGTVEGDETSEVRLTISDDFLMGYVVHGDDWWFVEPLKRFRSDAGMNEFLVYRTKDLDFELDLGSDLESKDVATFDPGSLPPGSAALPGGPSTSTSPPKPHQVGPAVGIALVADAEYAQQASWAGAPWHQYQIGVLHLVNGLYKKNLGCWFTPRVWILSKKALTSCHGSTLLDQLEAVVKSTWSDLGLVASRIATGTEVAHLTTGKNLDGKLLGLARTWSITKTGQNIGGVHSLSQQQLIALTGGGGFGGPPNLGFQNMMLMAHEIGHSFAGAHNEADEWCVADFIWCWDYERSLMWPKFYDDNNPWISDGTRNKAHDNRGNMTTNMQSGRILDYV